LFVKVGGELKKVAVKLLRKELARRVENGVREVVQRIRERREDSK